MAISNYQVRQADEQAAGAASARRSLHRRRRDRALQGGGYENRGWSTRLSLRGPPMGLLSRSTSRARWRYRQSDEMGQPPPPAPGRARLARTRLLLSAPIFKKSTASMSTKGGMGLPTICRPSTGGSRTSTAVSAHIAESARPCRHPSRRRLLRWRHAPATYRSFDCKSRFSAARP
jgi:hypothetical protein